MKAKGEAFKYGDNIDTDVIIPARYLNTSDPDELAKHCMEDLDPSFQKELKEGDIIVAQRNFGCGSSREHAPLAIKSCGASCVIAQSFARLFYRNAINIGLPILECEKAALDIENGNDVEIDFVEGSIHNLTKNHTYKAQPFPEFIWKIIEAGGLINSIQKNLAKKNKRRK
jgi:3-isopropylmalate/(R)-2-methylmalate dehydratase small subunit